MATKLARRAVLASALLPTAFAGRARAQSGITLSLWHNHPEWKDRVIAILNKFEAAHPGVHIDLQEMPSSVYVPRMNTALAAGEAPDIIALNAGPNMQSAADAGYVLDLTNRIDVSMLTPPALAASAPRGKIFGVPIMGAYSVALYCNRDIFAKYELTPPTTWDQLIATAKTLKSKGVAPMMIPAQDGTIPGFLYMLIGSSILGEEGVAALRKGSRKLTDPDLVQIAVLLKEAFSYAQPGAIGTAYTEGKALFAMGRAGMMEAGSADYAGFTSTNPKANFTVVPFPAVPGGKPSTVTGMQGVFGVNSRSKHPEEAIAFLQWMLSKPAAQMVIDTITLSTSREVAPSDNRVMKEMVDATKFNDVRVWFEYPEIGKVFPTVAQKAQALFLGELSPEAFSKLLQDTVDPSAT